MAMRSVRSYIGDMLEAIDTAEGLIIGSEFDAYESSAFRGQRRGVERCIEIISEASRHLPKDILAQHSDIPWRNIRDIGNVLRHGYSSVDDKIIWSVVTTALPSLRDALNSMLASLPSDDDS